MDGIEDSDDPDLFLRNKEEMEHNSVYRVKKKLDRQKSLNQLNVPVVTNQKVDLSSKILST